MIFILLGLTSLSMTISRSIHVAVNGIISFFLITAYLKKKNPGSMVFGYHICLYVI